MLYFYFVRFRRSTVSPAEKKMGKKSVATETKPSFLNKHQFATVHIQFIRACARVASLFLMNHASFVSGHERGTGGKGEAKGQGNIFVRILSN